MGEIGRSTSNADRSKAYDGSARRASDMAAIVQALSRPLLFTTRAWLRRCRRSSKDYEFRAQVSEATIDVAATRLILNRLAPA